MTTLTNTFDHWIRTDFKAINTRLEAQYATLEDRAAVIGVGQADKDLLVAEGNSIIRQLLDEGNTDGGFEQAFDLLGNVGLYMAACRRHEITNPERQKKSPLVDASALAQHIAASIGVTPRFATAHLCTHNRAVNGLYRSFTSLPEEKIFIDYNTKGIVAYQRAADALLKILPLGISHPATYDLLVVCRDALQAVAASNAELYTLLDPQKFFYNVRPYYKPYRVGSQIYRGANAGDFAGINIIDLLLGLCEAKHPSYSRLLVEKFLFMLPADQQSLQNCMRMKSLMNRFLEQIEQASEPWYQKNLGMFLEACAQHGVTASQHHDQLVKTYIVAPTKTMNQKHMGQITASGPPLAALVQSLANLRDQRLAAPRDDIPTRYVDVLALKHTLETAQ